jgi:hypothetical protein
MGLALSVIFVVLGVIWLAHDSWSRRRAERRETRTRSAPLAIEDVHAWREARRQQHLAAYAPSRAAGFGYKTEWLAVRHEDVEAVISALGLEGVRSASWAEGTWAMGDGRIFVTPPMRGFVLVAGSVLGLSVKDGLSRIPKGLSAALDTEVLGFVSHRHVDVYGWARAMRGLVERMYLEGENGAISSEGEPPPEESALHAERLAARAALEPQEVMIITADGATTKRVIDAPDASDPFWADQEVVRRLALAWSLDPLAFDTWPDEVADGFIAERVAL